MAKSKVSGGGSSPSRKRDDSGVPSKKELKQFRQHCVGDVCFDEEGHLLVDLSKSPESCPIDLRKKILNYYNEGGEITFKMPVARPLKHSEL